jgi:predicted methyltransferase MtxX (methanogen marker protein 4)
MLYPGSAADPGAVMQIVPGVMDYLDKKKRKSYYEEVKTFKTNLDVVRECQCENSLMTLDVAKARVAAARGPADQADADRRLKLAMDQKKSDCDVSGDANNFHHVGPSEPAASLNPEGVEVK